ncbi:carbohydrate ABC transporter permease [Lachnoclostridium sp. Marseille-P6806]|uniref:carbohydrate ABC transporter permease n=1 Tax=Lachnoclostridium sp. Marseille-P6806 TaxID=2364793 RepID=UPI0013EF1B32|nr:sugar ABC transporter permease [Lachnoclostridium sp. Marseille-P6806]
MKKKSLYRQVIPYLFLLPAFVMMAVFSYYAIGKALVNSFMNVRFGVIGEFVGLENYQRAFSDPVFKVSFINQAVISGFAVFNSIFWPLLAAELLFFVKKGRFHDFLRFGFVVPMMVPSIVIILLWKYLYNPHFGFNSILNRIGLSDWTRNWLNEEQTALISIVLIGFPFVSGMYFLIFHTGLNTLSADINEAARIDGAASLQIVTKIHLPNVKPYIKTVFTLSLISSLSGFGNVFATTGGGPGYSTMIPALQMYQIAFGDGNFGYSSALGILLMAVIVIVTILSRKLFGEED